MVEVPEDEKPTLLVFQVLGREIMLPSISYSKTASKSIMVSFDCYGFLVI
jgi:hypothetical protein